MGILMRKSLLLMLCLIPTISFAKFINPMKFDGSDAQKQEVIQYIQSHVHKTYCEGELDMCQDTTLRMMERAELNSFKEATQATNNKIMDRVIKTYCDGELDMCSYSNINMMYKENLKASTESLTW